jgi:hypothetical protein
MSYPGQFQTAGDGGLVAPVGWVNTVTPGFATVKCGYVAQTDTVTADADQPTPVSFTTPSSWSDRSWVPDLTGTFWTCATSGIYSITVSQNMTVNNVAETVNPVVGINVVLDSNTTSENDQVLRSTQYIPIMTGGAQSLNMVLTGLINADAGSVLTVEIVDYSGNLSLTSEEGVYPAPAGYLGWHLIAQGEYGNSGVIVP